MKYSFESTVEKKDNGYVIQIPFNIWEVAKQRDVIQAELVLDDRNVDCELHPVDQGKGNYEIFIKEENAAPKESVKNVELGVPHKVLLHIGGSLIPMDQNSPYSLENPIRKIDSMNVIIQPEDGLCGQTCVAMLAGVTIDDVSKVMDCGVWKATMGHVISALNYYGIDHADVITFTQGKDAVLPKCCVMMEKMGRFCHYLVHYDGKFYDSNLGVIQEYDMSKLLGYLEIKC